MVITYIRGLIAPLISTNEPPSKDPKSVGFSRSDGVSLPVCKFHFHGSESQISKCRTVT